MNNTKVIENLNSLLAGATIFYQKLKSYHWMVSGRNFFQLHREFEEMYNEWGEYIDSIAERILTIKGTPLTTLESMLQKSQIKESTENYDPIDIVKNIANDLKYLTKNIAGIIGDSEKLNDRGTTNLMDSIRDSQEKRLWMLRAWLTED